MASRDQPVGGDQPRSLSEQLRLLEEQLNRLSDGGSARIAHPTRHPLDLPSRLGRPIGVAALPRAPMLGVSDRHDDDDFPRTDATARATFRRHAVIIGVSLLLLSSTAIIPSLWHFASPAATDDVRPAVSLRMEQFAHTARELGRIPSIAPARVAKAAMPERSQSITGTDARPVATLTVAESDLARLSLPMLVSGGGQAWAGSAVVIDGLPAEARVSHGMKIAPDTWTVGIADVIHAVLSLPRTTPDRLDLSVRVVAANSHELAASALRIHVLRSPGGPAHSAPAAIFEPAAAETEAGEIAPNPTERQAVKVDRRRPVNPANPVKPAPTQMANQQDWPTTTSGWFAEERTAPPPAGFAPTPAWAPFHNR